MSNVMRNEVRSMMGYAGFEEGTDEIVKWNDGRFAIWFDEPTEDDVFPVVGLSKTAVEIRPVAIVIEKEFSSIVMTVKGPNYGL